MVEAWAASSMEEGKGADGVFGTARKDGWMAGLFDGWQVHLEPSIGEEADGEEGVLHGPISRTRISSST
jgi:hypothetical protein